MANAAKMNASFHMPEGSCRRPAAAVRMCNQLFPPQLAVGFLEVLAQLVALLRRHLARALRAPLALAIGVADIVAHALALLVLHLALAPAVVPARVALREGGSCGEQKCEQKGDESHGDR